MNIMKGINAYFRELTNKEIKNKVHREFVGGMWGRIR